MSASTGTVNDGGTVGDFESEVPDWKERADSWGDGSARVPERWTLEPRRPSRRVLSVVEDVDVLTSPTLRVS